MNENVQHVHVCSIRQGSQCEASVYTGKENGTLWAKAVGSDHLEAVSELWDVLMEMDNRRYREEIRRDHLPQYEEHDSKPNEA
jgi:hypothetical protein